MSRRIRFVAAGTFALALWAGTAAAPAYGARHPGGSTSQPQCTLSATAVGAPLVLTGSGYAPGASYQVDFVWPGSIGSAGTAAVASSAGDISVFGYAYWSGKYNATVAAGGKAVASCSTTVS
jgi:hypothetical protein